MSQYNEKVLSGYVSRLELRVLFSMIGWPIAGALLALFLSHLQADVFAVERVLTFGRVRVDPVLFQEQIENRVFLGIVAGAIIGFVKCQKYRVRAHEVLCMIQQERMLRQMVGRAERSHGQQHLVSK